MIDLRNRTGTALGLTLIGKIQGQEAVKKSVLQEGRQRSFLGRCVFTGGAGILGVVLDGCCSDCR